MKSLLRPLYHSLRKFLDTTLLGTKFQEWLWKREEFTDSKSYESMFEEAVKHPHRKFIAEKIKAAGPVHSALEIGCHQGYNLVVLHQTMPGVKLQGTDINARAIEEGRKRLSSLGIDTKLMLGPGDSLAGFSDDSVDVLFADAIVIYIGPDKIETAINEWLRVAHRSIFLYEWNHEADSGNELSHYKTGHWVHDYKKYFSDKPGVDSVTLHPIPDGINYQDTLWKKYGTLVEVRLKSK